MIKANNKGIPQILERILATGILIFCSPILLISGLLIKITSDGPALFRQKRVGKGGKEFILYKLRTMGVNNTGALVTASNDPRITLVGKFLRKTKIDELPQLWNVVEGTLLLVGPRPEVPTLVDLSDPLWKQVLTMTPGLTDPVTLKLRNEEDLMAAVKYDKEIFYKEILQPYKLRGYIEYSKKRTWKSDIYVLIQTIFAVLISKFAVAPSPEEIRNSPGNS